MKIRSTILTATAFAMPWIAQAQPVQGFYLSAGAGLSLPLTTKVTPAAPGFAGTFDLGRDPGYDSQISAGYALGNGWRFELEGTLGRADVNGASVTFFPATAKGNLSHWGVIANALFDLDIGSPYVFPYMGVGAGYRSTRLSSFSLTRTDRPGVLLAGGNAGGLAVQGIAGLSFPIPNVPGLSITADYRLTDALGGLKFNGTSSIGGGSTATSAKFHNQFEHGLILGIRFAFGATSPP